MSSGSDHASRTPASLLIRVRDLGDQQAWAEFERRYAPMIRGWCRRWFPRETDDKVQDVFIKLVKRLRTYEYDPGRGRFRGWLKTVTQRLMKDLSEMAPPPVADGEQLLELAEAGQDLMERLAAEYDLELLEKAKEYVRSRVEDWTWRAYVETAELGRKPAEVARERGIKVGAVYQARYSVREELRRVVKALEGLG